MNAYKRLIFILISGAFAPVAWSQGEIYKCPDATGRQTYTNIQRDTVGKSCTVVSREVSVVPAAARPVQQAAARPASAVQQVSAPAGVQQASLARSESRRKILESELQSEEQALGQAKAKLAEQEGHGRVQDRLKPYQETVELHQKNVEQLRREISGIK